MVAEARPEGLYADLAVGDMLTFLERAPLISFDLVIAADAVVYAGDLSALCAAAVRALAPGGRLAFTVERHAGADFALGENRAGRSGAGLPRRRLDLNTDRHYL
jgi:predicted TPR repeat methyltransferase